MNKMSLFKRVGAAVVAGAALSSVVVLATAGSAAAATTPNQFTLCATGNYSAGALFPDRGDLSTVLVPAGHCLTLPNTRDKSSDTVVVLGRYNTHPDVSFTVGSFTFNDSVGGGADASGTTTAPRLLPW